MIKGPRAPWFAGARGADQGWYFQAPFSIFTITRARWSRPRWSVGDMLKMPCAPGSSLTVLERVAQRGAELRRAGLGLLQRDRDGGGCISRPASQAWAPKVDTEPLPYAASYLAT